MNRRLRQEVLSDILTERERQLTLKEDGRFKYTPSDPELTDAERLTMLMEEVGEAARETLARAGLVTDGGGVGALAQELTQAAAICVAWIERLYEDAEVTL